MIEIDLAKCTGCRMCETACSFYHTGSINRHTARVKVVHIYETGVDGPVVCCQCRERYCLDCAAGAIRIGPLGQVVVSPTTCTLCGKCERNCPIGAVEMFDGFVYVCDLCGGSPRCVEACSQGALVFDPGKTGKTSLAETREETLLMKGSEKRFHHISRLGVRLREKWQKEKVE